MSDVSAFKKLVQQDGFQLSDLTWFLKKVSGEINHLPGGSAVTQAIASEVTADVEAAKAKIEPIITDLLTAHFGGASTAAVAAFLNLFVSYYASLAEGYTQGALTSRSDPNA